MQDDTIPRRLIEERIRGAARSAGHAALVPAFLLPIWPAVAYGHIVEQALGIELASGLAIIAQLFILILTNTYVEDWVDQWLRKIILWVFLKFLLDGYRSQLITLVQITAQEATMADPAIQPKDVAKARAGIITTPMLHTLATNANALNEGTISDEAAHMLFLCMGPLLEELIAHRMKAQDATDLPPPDGLDGENIVFLPKGGR